MGLMLHNTMTRRKEPFDTVEPGVVRMYVCGPTVYDKAHLGHARSSIVFDVIRRYLEYRGYRVQHVMNYTDVDDKVIQRAHELELSPLEMAESYLHEYERHLRDLNVLPAVAYPRVSTTMAQIIDLVQRLIETDHAYQADGDVYFRVATDPDYGKLSGRRSEDMRAGARIEVDERKEDAADFALWKASKPGEIAWDSPWGKGRPGWHIECSAMSLQHLGEQIDIHGGGNDLIFPHHENEIAQTESLTGRPFSRFWVHNGMLQLGEMAMSKSKGIVVTIDDFLRQYDGDVLRMIFLNSGYRSPLTYNAEVLEQAQHALERMRGALRPASPSASAPADLSASLAESAHTTRAAFEAAMDDDFNTPAALGHLFDFVRAINQARDEGAAEADLAAAQSALLELAGVLGLKLRDERRAVQGAAPFIEILIEMRQELRKAKLWQLSDVIRDRLADLGVIVEDGKEGTQWRQR